jgi:tetratricopeptide (TPR) repeat protein
MQTVDDSQSTEQMSRGAFFENKNVLVGGVLLLLVIFTGVLLRIIMVVDESQPLDALENLVLPQCVYSTDTEAYNKMIETGDVSLCECIQDEVTKSMCTNTASDTGLFKRALEEKNIDSCNAIQDEISRESCVLAVQDVVAHVPRPEEVETQLPNLTIEDYERIRAERPQDVENLLNLARMHIFMASNTGTGQINAEDLKVPQTILEEIKQIDSNNKDVFLLEGNIFVMTEKYEEAIVAYNKSIELDPNSVDSYVGRASAYNHLEKYDMAITEYEKVLELDKSGTYSVMFVDMELCRLYGKTANRDKTTEMCGRVVANGVDEEVVSEAKNIIETL